MKAILSCFIFAACQLCFAADDTNVIAISDWSKPISLQDEHVRYGSIRGRLLIVHGMEPALAEPTTNWAMTFVELQNVTRADGEGIEVCFDVEKLHCQLSDTAGKPVPMPDAMAWSGRGPFAPSWVNLPYNSTIRLFVNGGAMDPLAVFPSGEPWAHWSIAGNDTNTYFLTGTLNLFTHTNLSIAPEAREMFFKQTGTATLEFPKVSITTSKMVGGQQPK